MSSNYVLNKIVSYTENLDDIKKFENITNNLNKKINKIYHNFTKYNYNKSNIIDVIRKNKNLELMISISDPNYSIYFRSPQVFDTSKFITDEIYCRNIKKVEINQWWIFQHLYRHIRPPIILYKLKNKKVSIIDINNDIVIIQKITYQIKNTFSVPANNFTTCRFALNMYISVNNCIMLVRHDYGNYNEKFYCPVKYYKNIPERKYNITKHYVIFIFFNGENLHMKFNSDASISFIGFNDGYEIILRLKKID